MNIKKLLPSTPEVTREVVVVLLGAFIAVLIVRQLPESFQQLFNLNKPGGNQP